MSETREDPQGDVEAIGLLAEPTRRHLYRHVVDAGRALSREEAAEATGVPVHTAKFHLDKLVEGGLLSTEFHKLTGRNGPGSGRPSKHYRRNDAEIAVTLPPRQYDLLSRVLADAVDTSSKSGEPVAPVVSRVARETGRDIGREYETDGNIEAALRSCGYEPTTVGNDVILCNCPFHQAATRHTELVCGLNLDFVTGLLEGMGAAQGKARLAPVPGQCCVKVRVEELPETATRAQSAAR